VLNPQTRGGRSLAVAAIAGASDFADGRARDVRGIEVLGDTAVAFNVDRAARDLPEVSRHARGVGRPLAGSRGVRAAAGRHGAVAVSLRGSTTIISASSGIRATGAVRRSASRSPFGSFPRRSRRAAEFLAGRISVVEVPFGETKKWEQEHPDWLKRKPALRPIYVPLNNRRGPLRDPRVRQAINHAVNVPEILRTVWNGRGALAAGSIPPRWAAAIPRGAPTATTRRKHGACCARRIPERVFPAAVGVSGTNVEMGRVAQAIQAQLAALGIQVEIGVARRLEHARSGPPKATPTWRSLTGGPDYPDADNFLYPLFHSASGWPGGNYAFYNDRVTDSLIMVARRTVDQSAREALYARIDQRVFDAAPWLYLWFAVDLWASIRRSTAGIIR